MSDFTNPIATRTGTVQQQQIRPTASTAQADVAQGLSNLVNIYQKDRMQRESKKTQERAVMAETQISEGVLGLRDLRTELSDQKVSGVRIAEIERDYLGKYNDPVMRKEIIGQTNKLTGNTLSELQDESEVFAQGQIDEREELEFQLAGMSGFLSEMPNIGALDNEGLRQKILEATAIQSYYQADSTREALVASRTNNKIAKQAAEFKAVRGAVHGSVITPILQQMNVAIQEADFSDQSQVGELISSIELQRATLGQSINEQTSALGINLNTSQMEQLVADADKSFERNINFLQQTASLKGIEGVNKKAVQELNNTMMNSPDPGIRLSGYIIGMNTAGAGISINSGEIGDLTRSVLKMVKGDNTPDPETDQNLSKIGKAFKSKEGTVIAEDVQEQNKRAYVGALTGVQADIDNFVQKGGLSSLLDAVGNGNSLMFKDQDKEEVISVLSPQIERLTSSMVSRFATQKSSLSGSTLMSTADSLSQYDFNPDTLQFRIKGNNPFMRDRGDMRALNTFFTNVLNTYEKLGPDIMVGDKTLVEAYKISVQNAMGIVQEEK